MAAITMDRDCLTLINTFTVDPDRADELTDLLASATHDTMRHLDGFISASIHVADDRTSVANYAQWRDRAAFDAMLTNAEAQVHMRRAAEIARDFSPVLYRLVETESA